MQPRAPRNIRDIAHLYISRRRRGALRIILSGARREWFPGFHAANLAAAFAVDGYAVRLVERSGLLPNAGFFMGLPPAAYAAPGRADVSSVSALGGVDVWFTPPPPGVADASLSGSEVVELVHAPPLDAEVEFAYSGDHVVFVTGEASDADRLPRVWSWTLHVGDGDGSEQGGTTPLGRISRWRYALREPVPAVVRDPGSTLAQSYRECCERLASRHIDRSTHERRLHAGRASETFRPRGA
jgi:hypothetical protein